LDATAPVSPDATLREVGKQMRADLFRRSDRLEDIARIKFIERKIDEPEIPGVVLEVSNIGGFKIKYPVVDAWASLRLLSSAAGDGLAVMTFTVFGEKKREMVLRLRYADGRVGDDEAFAITKMIAHTFRHVSLDRTVKSVWEELRTFYAENC
jgi:hypothetical protein